MFKRSLLFLAIGVCAAAHAAALSAQQPLSTWRRTSATNQAQMIDAMADQLRMSAGLQSNVAIPVVAIAQCVDRNPTPDQVTIHGHRIAVTVGIAVVLCIKINVPQLRTAKYALSEP